MVGIEERNIKKLVEYFVSGSKKKEQGLSLGLELEHFITHKDTKETVSFYGDRGVAQVLEKLSKYYNVVDRYEGCIVGLGRDEIAITTEPAAQIEVSIIPKKNINEIEEAYKKFRREITPILDAWDYCLIEMGYQPKTKVDEIKLIPKKRYQYMDQYFHKIKTNGKYMMKGTASTQVSIDYYCENDFIKKYRAAYLLSPLLCLLTDNSPIFEGELYKGNLLRASIWEDVDDDRVDILKYFSDKEISFEEYARFVYQVPLIFYESQGTLIQTTKSAGEIYKNKEMTLEEVEHVLSMVFPDIRLKKYIEIRYADSLPIEGVLSYLALLKGLFGKVDTLDTWIEKLEVTSLEAIKTGRHEIMKNGLEATIYNRPVMVLLKELFAIAMEHLQEEEIGYLKVMEEQVIKNKKLFKTISKGSGQNEH